MLDQEKAKGYMGILGAIAGAFGAIRKLLARDKSSQTVDSNRSSGPHLNNSGQITLNQSTLNVTAGQSRQWTHFPDWELETTGSGGTRGDWSCAIKAKNLGGTARGVEVFVSEADFHKKYGSVASHPIDIGLNFRDGAPDTLIVEIRALDENGEVNEQSFTGRLGPGGYKF